MPIDDDIDALKSVIWLATDRQYKTGVSRLTSVKANRAVNVAEEDTSADLSRETAQKAVLPLKTYDVNIADWEKKTKEYSALFGKYPDVIEGDASFTSNANNQYVVNSEGTSVRSGTIQYRLMLYATTQELQTAWNCIVSRHLTHIRSTACPRTLKSAPWSTRWRRI